MRYIPIIALQLLWCAAPAAAAPQTPVLKRLLPDSDSEAYLAFLEQQGDVISQRFGGWFIPTAHRARVVIAAARILQEEGYPRESYLDSDGEARNIEIVKWVLANPAAYALIVHRGWRPLERHMEPLAFAVCRERNSPFLQMPKQIYVPPDVYEQIREWSFSDEVRQLGERIKDMEEKLWVEAPLAQ